jgi:hypothetical protein
MNRFYSAGEASQMLMEFADNQQTQRHRAIPWPKEFPTLQKYAPDLFPGQVMVFQSCPGEGKSLFGSWFKRYVANRIIEHSGANIAQNKDVVLSYVLEETVELERVRTMRKPLDFVKIASGELSRQDLLDAVIDSAVDPIFYYGLAMAGQIIHPSAKNYAGMTPNEYGEAIYKLQVEDGFNVQTSVIDYIQLSPDNKRSDDWVKRVSNASIEHLHVARNTVKGPSLFLAQSNINVVKERAGKIPELRDIQWSSQIGKDADIVLSAWKIIADVPLGKSITLNARGGKFNIPSLKDLIVVRVSKYRNCADVTGETFVMCMGKPIGNLFEVSLDVLNSLDVDYLASRGIDKYVNIPESMRR